MSHSLTRPLLLDAHQAAALLNVRVSWLREASRRGDVPHVKFPNSRLIRYRVADLEEWIQENLEPGRRNA